MDKLKELNLLLLEDNLEFAKNTIDTLKIYFKKVTHAVGVQDALAIFENSRIDLIISDIKVKDGNGLDFISLIREIDKQIPIIVLSAHKDEEFLFKAISLNILSYELKPLSYKSLNKLLENINLYFTKNNTKVIIGKELYYNYKSKELQESGKNIKLTKKEILFLELLLKNHNNILTDELIQKNIWEDQIMGEGALKNFIFRFRKKVKEDFLTTVTNVGYKLSYN